MPQKNHNLNGATVFEAEKYAVKLLPPLPGLTGGLLNHSHGSRRGLIAAATPVAKTTVATEFWDKGQFILNYFTVGVCLNETNLVTRSVKADRNTKADTAPAGGVSHRTP